MTSKNRLRVLVAKDPACKITAIRVPNPKFANKIGLHPPGGGTVQTIEVAAKRKRDTPPLDTEKVEELLATGQLASPKQPARSKRR